MHDSDPDQIARLIEWHTLERQPSAWPQAVDLEAENIDRSAGDADFDAVDRSIA